MYSIHLFAGAGGGIIPQEMPREYVLEMIADWLGAGRAITGKWDNVLRWYTENHNNMKMHKTTRALVEFFLFVCLQPTLKYWK
jgi:hypothetical protein